MKKKLFIFFALVFCLTQTFRAQIPVTTLVQIVKAEDERRYDAALENLLKNTDAKIRQRAALAAGRIGDERAIPALIAQLSDNQTAAMILFALGEIESPSAAPEIMGILKNSAQSNDIRARAIEAAGKIAANPKDAKTPELGKAIVSALENEFGKKLARHRETVLLGITAVLRARLSGGEAVTAKFLDNPDAGIRADALNTLARLRSKNVNDKARELLAKDFDPIVRANAARMLGAGEDKSAIDLLLNAATKDVDSRVRVSAIRSLGSLKDSKAVSELLRIGNEYLKKYPKEFYETPPSEKNELLEIASTLGKILAGSNTEEALKFLNDFGIKDSFNSPEIHVAIAKISPDAVFKIETPDYICSVNYARIVPSCWQFYSGKAQGLAELASLDSKKSLRERAAESLRERLKNYKEYEFSTDRITESAIPDTLQAFASFKTNDLVDVVGGFITYNNVFARASAAGLLAENSSSKENIEALKSAFTKSLLSDKYENDAQLAILNALYKLDKYASVGTFLLALDAPDYLVRKRAFEILKDADLQKGFPGIRSSLESFTAKKGHQVLPYATSTGTKLGQVFYTNADYIRAVSRKNGTVKAVLTTTKGDFTIDFFPEDAPLAVDNFIKLARANYFNGVSVHRVVPNFVMQDGDPRGDGNGGPGWQIRCEINMLPYERGAVGMALSGKDTGGSQWFVTHSPQPHLDGGYTVFGKVNENDMKVVDSIVRGDKILTVRIVGETPRKVIRSKRKF